MLCVTFVKFCDMIFLNYYALFATICFWIPAGPIERLGGGHTILRFLSRRRRRGGRWKAAEVASGSEGRLSVNVALVVSLLSALGQLFGPFLHELAS